MTPVNIVLAIVILACLILAYVIRRTARQTIDGMVETLKHSASMKEESDKARKGIADMLRAQTAAMEVDRARAVGYAEELLSKRIGVAKREEIKQFLKQSNRT